MSARIKMSVLGAALLLAACGMPPEGTSSGSGASTTLPGPSSTTTAVPAPLTTFQAPSTTTTTVFETTTTSTGGTSDDKASAFLASLDSDNAMTSGRIEGSIEITGLDPDASGLSDGTMIFSTSFNSATGDNSFLFDVSSMINPGEYEDIYNDLMPEFTPEMLAQMEVRQVGDTVFVRYPFFAALFGVQTEWISMDSVTGQDFTGQMDVMPTDPNEMLRSFDRAGIAVEEVGLETVNGVETTRYHLSLDTGETTDFEGLGLAVGGVIPADLWIGGDGYVVRMIIEIDGTGVEASPSEQFDMMTFRYDVFEINQDVVIEVPPASQVTAAEDIEGFVLGLGY